MLLLQFLTAFACVVCNVQTASSSKELLLPFAIAGRPLFGFNGQHLRTHDADDTASEKYFTQNLNQSSQTDDAATFKQRYFVNTQWKGNANGAVHILYIEGDGPASVSKVKDVSLPHVALAKDLGATAWILEHRFYGKSQPFSNTTIKNLAYLNSQHAVEDIAKFIDAQNKDSKDSKPKWIVVGASYGGSLALWFRQKYPSKCIGAVSDSAAIQPTLDFWTYEKSIEEAYSNYSYECWHGIKFSALAIRNEIQYETGVERMNEQLNLQPKIDDLRVDYKDYQHLHHNLLSLFDIPVLFNKVNLGPFSDSCDISDVCQIMTNETGGANGDAERVLQLASMLYTASYGKFKGINNDYKGLVNYLSNINYDEKNLMQASARSYLWQQCSEFGQFMSTDSGRGLFASSVPNDYFIALCSDVFHHSISVETLKTALKNTLDVYGGRSHYYTGTNTLIFHGQTDPWKNLGVNSTKDSSSKVYLTSDVGHAAVLQPPKDTDPYSLKFARKNVLNAQVKKWVKAASNHQKHLVAIPKKDTKEESKVEPTSPKYPEIKNWEGSIEYAEHPTIHPFKDFKAFVAQSEKDKLVADQQPKRRPPGFTDTLRRHMLLNKQDYANNTGHVHNKYLKTGFILQDVDHFDKTNALQYSQRFFSNYQFQRDQNASRFLMLGGEAAIDWEYVEGVTFQYYQWAKDFKAVITLSVANLRYLNTEQVLADTAVFVTNMNKAENQTNPRWIVFGGSYPGNLAAIFRVRYPQLSLGAIASSAPLQAKVDFFEYMQKVESDVKAYGKEGCHSAVRRYFSWIRQKMNTRPGRVQVKAVFCFSNDWHENYADEKDVEYFITSEVYDLMWYTQYDSENHWYLKSKCDYYKRFDDKYGAGKVTRSRHHHPQNKLKIAKQMGLPLSYLTGIAHTNMTKYTKEGNHPVEADEDYYTGDYSDPDDSSKSEKSSDSSSGDAPIECYCDGWCSYISYSAYLKRLQDDRNFMSVRQWYWLTCTQWGYSESTNYGYNIFESSLPVNHGLDLCADIFGEEFNRTSVEGGVTHINYMYGGSQNYKGENVVLVYGSEDPWSTLGVYKPIHPESAIVIAINGTSHCMDMYREVRNDVKDLKKLANKSKTL